MTFTVQNGDAGDPRGNSIYCLFNVFLRYGINENSTDVQTTCKQNASGRVLSLLLGNRNGGGHMIQYTFQWHVHSVPKKEATQYFTNALVFYQLC